MTKQQHDTHVLLNHTRRIITRMLYTHDGDRRTTPDAWWAVSLTNCQAAIAKLKTA